MALYLEVRDLVSQPERYRRILLWRDPSPSLAKRDGSATAGFGLTEVWAYLKLAEPPFRIWANAHRFIRQWGYPVNLRPG